VVEGEEIRFPGKMDLLLRRIITLKRDHIDHGGRGFKEKRLDQEKGGKGDGDRTVLQGAR